MQKEKIQEMKAQLDQLQAYVQSTSLIREQFDSNRIAKDQVQIMQDLRMENLNLSIKVKSL